MARKRGEPSDFAQGMPGAPAPILSTSHSLLVFARRSRRFRGWSLRVRSAIRSPAVDNLLRATLAGADHFSLRVFVFLHDVQRIGFDAVGVHLLGDLGLQFFARLGCLRVAGNRYDESCSNQEAGYLHAIS